MSLGVSNYIPVILACSSIVSALGDLTRKVSSHGDLPLLDWNLFWGSFFLFLGTFRRNVSCLKGFIKSKTPP